MNLASFSVHKMSASHLLGFFPGLLIIHNYCSVTLGLKITLEQLAERILEAIWVSFNLIHRALCLLVLSPPLVLRRKGTDVAGIQTAALTNCTKPPTPRPVALLSLLALCHRENGAHTLHPLPCPGPLPPLVGTRFPL